MREGLYEIKFKTPMGEGRGLVTLQNGQVLGGDAIIIYSGTFTVEGDRFLAYVSTSRYATEPGFSSVLGRDNARIDIAGAVQGELITGQGQSPDAPGLAVHVHLRRIAP